MMPTSTLSNILHDFLCAQQTAAKNAYVLLGKHQHSLAAAFFLLGRHYDDCIGVCAREMGDPQLALFLSVLIDRSGGSFRKTMIEKVACSKGLCKWILCSCTSLSDFSFRC